MAPLSISGATLADFQACERRFVLARDWQPARWRPKALFDHCLRWAIFELSLGGDPAAIADGAVQQFIEGCTDPGIDIVGDPYTYAKDYCAMLQTITRCVAKLTLLKLHRLGPVKLDGCDAETLWTPLAFADDSGELHRWITVSEWNQDSLLREAHSWHAFGDIAGLGLPMTLHAIHIGQNRNGRRASTWARGWRHPVLNKLRFRQTSGKPFEGWRSTPLADLRPAQWDAWADQIQAEGAATALISHVRLQSPSEAVITDTLSQIRTLVREMRFVLDSGQLFHQLPMSRGACDGIVPCPWQHACYSPRPGDTSQFAGLYRSRQQKFIPRERTVEARAPEAHAGND